MAQVDSDSNIRERYRVTNRALTERARALAGKEADARSFAEEERTC